MSTTTKNYNFVVPSLSDSPPDITATNRNWETVDQKLKTNESQISESSNIISSLSQKMDGLDASKINLTSSTATLYALHGSDAKVDKALEVLADCQMVSFLKDTANKTWVVPEGVTKIRIFACAAGSGRNAGGYVIGTEYTVTPGATMTFTVGTGNTIISGGGLTSSITLTAGSVANSLEHHLFGITLGVSGSTAAGNNAAGGFGGAFGFGGGGGGGSNNGGAGASVANIPGGAGGVMGGGGGPAVAGDGGDGQRLWAPIKVLKYLPDLLTTGGGGGGLAYSPPNTSGRGGTSGSGILGGAAVSGGGGGSIGGSGGGAGGYGAGGGLGGGTYISGYPGNPSPGMVLICYGY